MRLLTRYLMLVMLQLSAGPCLMSAAAFQLDTGRSCLRGHILPMSPGGTSQTGVAVTLRGGAYLQDVNAVMYGSFEFCNMPAGDYTLEARANGFDMVQIPLRNWGERGQETGLIVRMWPVSKPPIPLGAAKTVKVRTLTIPQKARAELERFRHFAARQDWEKSLAALAKATENYPDYLDAWINMGIVYTKLSRTGDAETAYRRAIEINPEEPTVRRKLGLLYLSEHQLEKALPELETAANLNPLDARTQIYLGQCLSKAGNSEKAEGNLKRALVLEPDMPRALYELGFVQLKQDRPQEALATFERFLNRGMSTPETEEVRALVSKLRMK